MTPRAYQRMAQKRVTPSPVIKDCVFAFVGGGTLCAVAQAIILLTTAAGMTAKDARLTASLSLIVLSVALTALCVYDTIAKHVGAGVIVPITGFANSMASPAMEFKSEGFVLGMAAKMFSIAGPVIVYGTVASVVYGIIYWAMSLV